MPKKLLSLLLALVVTAPFVRPAIAANDPAQPQVSFETNRGQIVIELFAAQAPITTANFLKYVDAGFYDGLIFHRVIDGFVVQAGGFDRTMSQRQTNAPIKNEAGNGLKNARGTLSMARTNDPDSADSQFFINLVDNANLDRRAGNPGYAVFGKVVKGMDVVDAIAKVATGSIAGMDDVPTEMVVIERARRVP
jgi:cyclophilin family peptidyl-prolyl cis-trans isomerase